MVHPIPAWMVWAEIECKVDVALPKLPIFRFQPVQQSRQQALKANCPKLYTMIFFREMNAVIFFFFNFFLQVIVVTTVPCRVHSICFH